MVHHIAENHEASYTLHVLRQNDWENCFQRTPFDSAIKYKKPSSWRNSFYAAHTTTLVTTVWRQITERHCCWVAFPSESLLQQNYWSRRFRSWILRARQHGAFRFIRGAADEGLLFRIIWRGRRYMFCPGVPQFQAGGCGGNEDRANHNFYEGSEFDVLSRDESPSCWAYWEPCVFRSVVAPKPVYGERSVVHVGYEGAWLFPTFGIVQYRTNKINKRRALANCSPEGDWHFPTCCAVFYIMLFCLTWDNNINS